MFQHFFLGLRKLKNLGTNDEVKLQNQSIRKQRIVKKMRLKIVSHLGKAFLEVSIALTLKKY